MDLPSWLFVPELGMSFTTSLKHSTVARVAVIHATVPFDTAALG